MGNVSAALLESIKAVFEHWELIVGCGVIAFVIDMAQKLLDRKMPKKWYAIFVAMGFVLATFKAWDDQYRAVIAAQNKLTDLTVPRLKLTIDEVGTGNMSFGKVRSTGAIVIASVTNDGSPSVAEGWRLKIVLPDRRSWGEVPTYMNPAGTLTSIHSETGADFKLSQADALYTKTAEHAVERGNRVRGILVFQLAGITREEAKQAGAKFTLKCTDV